MLKLTKVGIILIFLLGIIKGTDAFAIVDEKPVVIFKARWGEKNGEFGVTLKDGIYWTAPRCFAVDKNGSFYIDDVYNDRIQIFDRKGKFLFSIGGRSNKKDDFGWLREIEVDTTGYIYVTDVGQECVKKFSFDGNLLFQIEELRNPTSLVVGEDGNIYVDADSKKFGKGFLKFSDRGEFIEKEINEDFIGRDGQKYNRYLNRLKEITEKKVTERYGLDALQIRQRKICRLPMELEGLKWAWAPEFIGYDYKGNTYWVVIVERPQEKAKLLVLIYDEEGSLIQNFNLEPLEELTGGKKVYVDYWGNLYQLQQNPQKGIEILKYEVIE